MTGQKEHQGERLPPLERWPEWEQVGRGIDSAVLKLGEAELYVEVRPDGAAVIGMTEPGEGVEAPLTEGDLRALHLLAASAWVRAVDRGAR